MNLRVLALAMVLVGSCSTQPRPCGPGSCMGCCDEAGECLSGTALTECGARGGMCTACSPREVCRDGTCQLFMGADYDASFPPDPDGNYNLDAGVYDASRPDSGVDAGLDAGRPDAGLDAGFDAGRPDAGVDAGTDAGIDAGVDGGADAGTDAGADAGADAGDGG